MSKQVYVLQQHLPDYKKGSEIEWDGTYYTFKEKASDGIAGRWPALYVENNPEWFLPKKEEKNKEWEVTKIKGQTSYRVYTMNEESIWVDCYNNGFCHDFNRDGSKGLDCDIIEVRRLSDNTVFSIGDEVNCDKCPESFSKQKIEKFIISDFNVMVASCAGVATSINNISKLPPDEKADTPFQWTEALIKEFIMSENLGYSIELLNRQINGFKRKIQNP